jgi:hypothetical protein
MIVEVITVTTPSLRRARRQLRPAGQLCWTLIWQIQDVRPPHHHDAAGASGWGIGDNPDTHTMPGHQGYLQLTGSNEPGPLVGLLGLGWLESAHRWIGTTCQTESLDCLEWSSNWEKHAGMGVVEPGGKLRTQSS